MDEFPQPRPTGAWWKTGALALMGLAVVLALAGAAAYLGERVKEQRETLGQQQRQIAAMEQRLGRLELQMEKQLVPRLPQPGSEAAVREAAPRAELSLTRGEVEAVREFIKIPPMAAGQAAAMSVGMSLAGQPLIPLPLQLVEKVPKLAGGRFRADHDGSIVIVAGGSDRVGFIIPPN